MNAETLIDPTQPPMSVNSQSDHEALEPKIAAPVLQSVMLGSKIKAAIINGQKVDLGKKYNEATLIKLSENSAVLKDKDGTTQILTMAHSGVKKTHVKSIEAVTPLRVKVKGETKNKVNTK